MICKLKLRFDNWKLDIWGKFGNLKKLEKIWKFDKYLETWKNLETWKKCGNLVQFRNNLDIWKKFGNLGKKWIFGIKLETWKFGIQFWNLEKIFKYGKNFGNLKILEI